MRYLGRTHRAAVSMLNEIFQHEYLALVYEESANMCVYIFTKAFTDAAKWEAVCWLINVVDPKRFETLIHEGGNKGQNTTPQSGAWKTASNTSGSTNTVPALLFR